MNAPREDDDLHATRRSLVARLGNLADGRSWQEFFDLYGPLLLRFARAAGLTDTEAQEAVQETVITVARNVGGLCYDPARGSFRGWLLQTARWRVADQFRQRRGIAPAPGPDGGNDADGPRTALADRVPDPDGPDLERLWDREWREHLLRTALDRVRHRADPRQFQIFDCYVTRGWPAGKVARELGVNLAQVYLAKHRVGALLRRAVAELEAGGTTG